MIRAVRRRTRLRLTLLYAVTFALVATAAMASFWLAFVHAEFGAIDESLSSNARSAAAGLQTTGSAVTFGRHNPLPGESPEGIPVSAVLVGPSGTALDRTGTDIPLTDVMSLTTQALAGRTAVDTVNVNGASSRVLAEPVDLGQGRRGALVLERAVVELNQTLARHAQLLGVIDVALVILASLLGYWLASLALRPVRVMAALAREISETRLSRRIDVDLAPRDELGELAATFNAMLERLDASFATLRRFTADAAHDLRAPLALMRSEVEVTLSQPRSAGEYQASLHTVLSETERLSRLANQLLLLARAESGAAQPQRVRVDVADLVDETVSRWRRLAAGREVTIETAVPDAGELNADPDLLRRLLDNLIDNAVRHTPPGGRIDVSATPANGGWQIDVQDTGEGISPALRDSLFEPFTRADRARGRETGGAGLGLAVCRVIAELHGGSIEVLDDAGGAHLRVALPAWT